MSLEAERPGDLDEILGALRDGVATPEQAGAFDRWLASGPDARREYLRHIALCASLRFDRVERAAIKPARRWRGRYARLANWSAVTLVALALGGLGGAALTRSWRPAPAKVVAVPIAAVPKAAPRVAVLMRAIDAEWGPDDAPPEPGAALPPGRLVLRAGLAQVEFYDGAILVMEGPAELVLLANDRALCRYGKVRVRAPLHRKFTLLTPGNEVVDLGTEFGVAVGRAGDSEIQVFEGAVELHRGRSDGLPGARREIVEGQGLHIDPAGVIRPAPVDAGSFVGAREIDGRSAGEAAARYRAWAQHSRSFRDDPHLLLYYTFEGQQRWERVVRDRAEGRRGRRDGGIVGGEWAEGRWPGKTALELKRASDRIRLDIPGEHRTLTLLAWVRVDGLDGRYKTSLVSSDLWERPGPLRWEILGDGRLLFAISKGVHDYSRPDALGPGQFGLWTHLAATLSADGTSRQYLNGRLLSKIYEPGPPGAIIGQAEIGNWNQVLDDPEPYRNLNGRIDEFAILDRTLSDAEVQALYEVGRPGSSTPARPPSQVRP